jgi:hypothetical protein
MAVKNPERIRVEYTSLHQRVSLPENVGYAVMMEMPMEINFVGPDPYTSRKFYGTLTVSNGIVKVR